MTINNNTYREQDLYAPVRDYLVALGYSVRGEVQHCDLCAIRGDELLVVELKQRLNLELVLQGVRRQRITNSVYVAVPREVIERMSRKRWRDIRHLLRRLELGLLLVITNGSAPRVEVGFHPIPFQRRKQSKERRAVIRETESRTQDLTPGGSTRTRVMTAYREAALYLACCLSQFGIQSPKSLRVMGSNEKTRQILYDNVYGWFERVGYAQYSLSRKGQQAIGEFSAVTSKMLQELNSFTKDL